MRKNVFVVLCHEQDFSTKVIPVLYDKGIPNHLKNKNGHIVIRELGSLEGKVRNLIKEGHNVILVANENESLLTSPDCKKIFQKLEIKPNLICLNNKKSELPTIESFGTAKEAPLKDFFKLDSELFDRKTNEHPKDTWIRFFKKKSHPKKISTPTGELNLEEVPSTH